MARAEDMIQLNSTNSRTIVQHFKPTNLTKSSVSPASSLPFLLPLAARRRTSLCGLLLLDRDKRGKRDERVCLRS